MSWLQLAFQLSTGREAGGAGRTRRGSGLAERLLTHFNVAPPVVRSRLVVARRYRGCMTADDAPQPIRVFLLDDHEVVRRGLAELLSVEPTSRSWANPAPPPTPLTRIKATRPNDAVLDVRLPDGSGGGGVSRFAAVARRCRRSC